MKIGVVGTNFVSDSFMNGAKLESRVEVVAVCSGRYQNAINFAEKHGIQNIFADYHAMCESGLIDSVYIATPNATHKEIAMYFLSNKINVFCEKPMASNVDEVAAMIECAKVNNTYLQEGLMPLFNPNFKKVKQSLDKLGKIHQATFNFSKYSSRYDAYLNGENPTTFRKEMSNGALMDLGVYVFGNVIGLFGKPNKIVACGNLLATGVDICGSSIFEYDDMVVNLAYSKASDTKVICEICGENGIITIDRPSQPRIITYYDRKSGEVEDLSVEMIDSFYNEIKEMVDCIQQGRIESISYPFEDMVGLHQVLTQTRKLMGVSYPADEQ